MAEHDADVVIVGAGALGAHVAQECAKAGKSVILLEAGKLAAEVLSCLDRHDVARVLRGLPDGRAADILELWSTDDATWALELLPDDRVPGIVAATGVYYLTVPLIRAYQNRRRKILRAKLDQLGKNP